VDDEVVHFQVAEVREEGRGRRSLLAGPGFATLLVEDVGLGVDD
jgi:hypothetical protein